MVYSVIGINLRKNNGDHSERRRSNLSFRMSAGMTENPVVVHHNAAAFLSPMLQGVKSEVHQTGHILRLFCHHQEAAVSMPGTQTIHGSLQRFSQEPFSGGWPYRVLRSVQHGTFRSGRRDCQSSYSMYQSLQPARFHLPESGTRGTMGA